MREPAFDRPETALPETKIGGRIGDTIITYHATIPGVCQGCPYGHYPYTKNVVISELEDTPIEVYQEYTKEFYEELKREKLGKLYIIGALKNRSIIDLGIKIRELGYDVFDDWLSPGPEADEQWQLYEAARGRSYKEALGSHHADTVFQYDLKHLTEAKTVVMVMPCGKSGHLEFGWAIGQGKTGYILFEEEPERYDVMYRFATDVFMNEADLLERLGN